MFSLPPLLTKKEVTEASFYHLSAKHAFDRKQCSSHFTNYLSEAVTLCFWKRYQSLLHTNTYPIGNIKLFHCPLPMMLVRQLGPWLPAVWCGIPPKILRNTYTRNVTFHYKSGIIYYPTFPDPIGIISFSMFNLHQYNCQRLHVQNKFYTTPTGHFNGCNRLLSSFTSSLCPLSNCLIEFF